MTFYSIKFSSNWGNKLNCYAFTTLRPLSNYYVFGQEYEIYLKDVKLGVARCMSVEQVTYGTLTPRVCLLDTGYNVEATRRLLQNIYKGITHDTKFALCTLVWVSEVPSIDKVPKKKPPP